VALDHGRPPTQCLFVDCYYLQPPCGRASRTERSIRQVFESAMLRLPVEHKREGPPCDTYVPSWRFGLHQRKAVWRSGNAPGSYPGDRVIKTLHSSCSILFAVMSNYRVLSSYRFTGSLSVLFYVLLPLLDIPFVCSIWGVVGVGDVSHSLITWEVWFASASARTLHVGVSGLCLL
jgi:hypothetical protein